MSLFQTTVAQLSPTLCDLLPEVTEQEDPSAIQHHKANILNSKIKEAYPDVEIVPDNDVHSLRILGLFQELCVIQKSLDSWAKQKHYDPQWSLCALSFGQSNCKDEGLQTDGGHYTQSYAQTDDIEVPEKSRPLSSHLCSVETQTDPLPKIKTDTVELDDDQPKRKSRRATKSYKANKKTLSVTKRPLRTNSRKNRPTPKKSYTENDSDSGDDNEWVGNEEDEEATSEEVYNTMLDAMLLTRNNAEQDTVLANLKTEVHDEEILTLPDSEVRKLFGDNVPDNSDTDNKNKKMGSLSKTDEDGHNDDPKLFEDLQMPPRKRDPAFSTEGHYNLLMKTEKGNIEVEANTLDESRVHKMMSYKCKYCEHITPDKRSLRDHLKRNHCEKKHVCPTCGKGFGLNKDLTRHMLYVHKKVYPCNIDNCSFRGLNKKHLERHVNAFHLDKARKSRVLKGDQSGDCAASCPHAGCEFTTNRTKNLSEHIKRSHGEKKHACPICNKMYAVRKDLNQHVRLHSQQFCCEICGKQLRSKFALTLHVNNIHKNMKIRPAKTYLCNTCGKLCRSKTEYKVHMNKEHLNVRPFKCAHCDQAFFARANLKMHQSVHSDIRDFSCDICGKAFKQRQGLKIHKKIHEVERPYKCDTCSKTFTQRGALTRHQRIHTGEKPYKCKLCSSSFNDYSILRRHVLGIHKIDDHVLVRRTASDESVAKSLARNPDGKSAERKRCTIRRLTPRGLSMDVDMVKDEYLKSTSSMAYLEHPGQVAEVQMSQDNSDRVDIILAAAQQSFLEAQSAERDPEVQAAHVLSHLQHNQVTEPLRDQSLAAGTIITLPDGRQGTILQQLPPGHHSESEAPTYLQLTRHHTPAPQQVQEAYMFQGMN